MKRFASFVLPLPLFLAACSPQRIQEFNINTYSCEERPVTCVIFLDDSPLLTPSNEYIVTPARIKIPFQNAQNEYGYHSVKLEVKSVQLDAAGKPPATVRQRDRSEYFGDFRLLYPNFASNQVFFLVNDASWQGRAAEPTR